MKFTTIYKLSILYILLTLSIIHADLIPYKIKFAASKLGNLFLPEDDYQILKNHGCWCAKIFDTQPSVNLGGPETVDELDHICKLWAKVRRCSKQEGYTCEFIDASKK